MTNTIMIDLNDRQNRVLYLITNSEQKKVLGCYYDNKPIHVVDVQISAEALYKMLHDAGYQV